MEIGGGEDSSPTSALVDEVEQSMGGLGAGAFFVARFVMLGLREVVTTLKRRYIIL